MVEVADARNLLDHYVNLSRYAERIHVRPAYLRALERGGPYRLGA